MYATSSRLFSGIGSKSPTQVSECTNWKACPQCGMAPVDARKKPLACFFFFEQHPESVSSFVRHGCAPFQKVTL